jgi:hypothetical protein
MLCQTGGAMVQYTQLPEMGGWPEKPIDRGGSDIATVHWVLKPFV